jgi:hypothetical protein
VRKDRKRREFCLGSRLRLFAGKKVEEGDWCSSGPSIGFGIRREAVVGFRVPQENDYGVRDSMRRA